MIEKFTLPIGIDFAGKIHKDVEMQPAKVRFTVDAYEDARAVANDVYFGLVVIAKRIVRLGDIPLASITPYLLLDAYQMDLDVIYKGAKLQNDSLGGFSDKPAKQAVEVAAAGAAKGRPILD